MGTAAVIALIEIVGLLFIIAGGLLQPFFYTPVTITMPDIPWGGCAKGSVCS